MTKIYFFLENRSGSEGMYLLNNEYVTLPPRSEIILDVKPVNCTENIKISQFNKEIVERKSKSNINKNENLNESNLIKESVAKENIKGE